LQLKACSTLGVCSKTQNIVFSIEKAWFNTGLFYFMIFLGIILIVFIISRAIIKHNIYLEKLLRDKETAEKERQLSKIKAIQAQMNPHFVFNALNSIQDYILSNQKELASEYLADFADLVRSYLKQTQKDFIEVEEEIETLHEYLKLEKLRLGENFEYKIEYLNQSDKIKGLSIPVMLIQPFVENSIKHGLLPKKGEQRLLIQFELVDDQLKIAIRDNGVGISQTKQKPTSTPGLSFGNKAVADKVSLLNNHHKLNLKIRYEEGFINQDEKGTTVIVSINAE
jgi:LytS/YehU family sensor histidine kinase